MDVAPDVVPWSPVRADAEAATSAVVHDVIGSGGPNIEPIPTPGRNGRAGSTVHVRSEILGRRKRQVRQRSFAERKRECFGVHGVLGNIAPSEKIAQFSSRLRRVVPEPAAREVSGL